MANFEFKCPCCGGTLQFDNKSQDVVCPYCDSHFAASDLKNYTDDVSSDKQEDTAWDQSEVQAYSSEEMEGMKVYTCNSCGGEIIAEETTTSTSCPYCGNNVLVSKGLSGDLKPNRVIPFKNDKEVIVGNLKKFFKKKPLLPGSFSKENTIEEIKPLYVPFWLFDADVDGKVRFKGEIVRRWSDSYYEYTETKYYSLVREGNIAFDHIPVDGSKKMEDKLMESIEPFDYNESTEFNIAYLAGFAADRYDVSQDETFVRATQRCREGTIEAFRNDITGYSNVTVADSNIQLSNTKAQYALYPVWIMNTKWRDKTFLFAVNGQSGKVAGDLPISGLRVFLFFLLFFLPCVGLGFLFGYLQGEDSWLYGLIGGAVVGILVALIGIFTMRKQNKNVQFQTGARNYTRPNSFKISNRKDIYLSTKLTKKKIDSNRH